jgi:molybdenum cofactor biosynthesis enzyme
MKQNKVILSLRMLPEEIDFLKKEAKKLDISVTNYIRMVIFKYDYLYAESYAHINRNNNKTITYKPYHKGHIIKTNKVINNIVADK